MFIAHHRLAKLCFSICLASISLTVDATISQAAPNLSAQGEAPEDGTGYPYFTVKLPTGEARVYWRARDKANYPVVCGYYVVEGNGAARSSFNNWLESAYLTIDNKPFATIQHFRPFDPNQPGATPRAACANFQPIGRKLVGPDGKMNIRLNGSSRAMSPDVNF